MLFVGTSIIHPSTEGVFLLCNILDLLIYSYKYYFPEEKLAYVREVDLSADFDTIWFLDTEMEWDFVPDQIIPYNLQIEYVGHYGIEYNEFDLYKVTKGAAGV